MNTKVEMLEKLSSAPLNPQTPKPGEFDIEALPTVLRTYAEELAKSLPIAVDLPAVAMMVVAGAAIGGSRFIEIKKGWREHAGLYAALVAPTGTHKTPALQKVVAPLEQLQTELAAAHKEQLKVYEDTSLPQYRADLKRFERGELAPSPTKPEPPVQGRTFTVDTTVERLAGLLADNPKGLLLLRDELSAWVRSLDQYRNGHGADRQFYLSAYSGVSHVVDRQGKPPIVIDRICLSVLGNIPPDVLPELSQEASLEDGFVHRMIFTFPMSVSVRWTEAIISEAAEGAYRQSIRALFGLRNGEPRAITFEPDARTIFRDWHDIHCMEMEDPDLSPGLRGFYAKYKGVCARLALIHALVENPYATAVPVRSIAAACDLTDYFKAQARKVLPLLPRQRLTPAERCEREILRNLAGGKICTDRELQRNGNTPAVVFREVLESLRKVGRIMRVPIPRSKGREGNQLAKDENVPL